MSANDRQIGGDHYKTKDGYEHWDFVCDLQLDYLTGVATKYVARWRKKDGIKDLEKAIHYVDKRLEVGAKLDRFAHLKLLRSEQHHIFWRFIHANQIPAREALIIWHMSLWESLETLEKSRGMIEDLISTITPREDSNRHAG